MKTKKLKQSELYIYALSIVGISNNNTNNSLYSGMCDLPTLIESIETLKYNDDFNDSIALVNFNIASVNRTYERQFNSNKYHNLRR